jgi:hypothetical protein
MYCLSFGNLNPATKIRFSFERDINYKINILIFETFIDELINLLVNAFIQRHFLINTLT